jgi:WD40 repeat protein
VAGTKDGRMGVFEITRPNSGSNSNLKTTAVLARHDSGVRGVQSGTNGHGGFIVSGSNDASVRIFPTPTLVPVTVPVPVVEPFASLAMHKRQVTAVHFDAARILSTSVDCTVSVAMCKGAVW